MSDSKDNQHDQDHDDEKDDNPYIANIIIKVDDSDPLSKKLMLTKELGLFNGNFTNKYNTAFLGSNVLVVNHRILTILTRDVSKSNPLSSIPMPDLPFNEESDKEEEEEEEEEEDGNNFIKPFRIWMKKMINKLSNNKSNDTSNNNDSTSNDIDESKEEINEYVQSRIHDIMRETIMHNILNNQEKISDSIDVEIYTNFDDRVEYDLDEDGELTDRLSVDQIELESVHANAATINIAIKEYVIMECDTHILFNKMENVIKHTDILQSSKEYNPAILHWN